MRFIVKFIVIFLTWPFVLLVLSLLSLAYLCFYSWGCRDDKYMALDDIKSLAYYLWHCKAKKK